MFISEYDRIFIYRCIVDQKSAVPDKYDITLFSIDEKKEISDKIIDVYESIILFKDLEFDLKKSNVWRIGLESRLGVVVDLSVDTKYSKLLQRFMYSGSPENKVNSNMAKFLIEIMIDEEKVNFLYTNIILDCPDFKNKDLWLVGTDKRMLLVAKVDCVHKLLWVYDKRSELILDRVKNNVSDDCTLKGGCWEVDEFDSDIDEFIIKGRALRKFDNYFNCILQYKGK